MKPLPLLDGLLAPADLRKFTPSQLVQIAEEIRYRIKETVSTHGGHLASNLGTVELTLALHRVFDFSSDRLLWDVGHQAYPHKLVTGRAKTFDTNRQEGGISGFPDPIESPYDLAKVGHSSTAISTGVGVSEGYRRLGQSRHTVVVVGDGALTGGMAFEGLINAGELKSDLIVVLNDNGNFIDAPVGSLHTHLDRIRSGQMYQYVRERFKVAIAKFPRGKDLARLAKHLELAADKLLSPGYIFEDLGFKYFGPVNGHDIVATEEALTRVSKLKGPILLHVMTKKGGGWQPSVDDPLKFHGPKGFDLDTGSFHPKAPASKTYSQVFADALLEIAREDERLVAITAAMPSGTGLRQFAQEFPDRMYDVGICEQHSFAFAEGFAVAGLRPVVAHYSTFAQRGYDQLFQEVVVQRNLGIVITLDRAGMVGEDGETHQGLYDIAWSRTLPGLVIMAPKDGGELRAMLRWCHDERCRAETRAAGYCIRYPREEVPAIAWTTEPAPIARGKAEVLKHATVAPAGVAPLMIWAYGAMVRIAWNALAELGDAAAGVTLVNARFVKPLDNDLLAELASSHAHLLTLEDHALMGGFGAAVAEAVADLGLTIRLSRGGVRDELVPHAGRDRQLALHGLDQAGVVARIRDLLGIRSNAIQFPKMG
ncbi:MAG: 1-deoxy-D-xylulose-5-phosphate synthase [Planctomycetes bacterium]|nr:1-deoxy-D-xylulose-5-phosphate synthase [Planctomycetota bacterium]